ncbi:hypothetical protein [uncultured Friedmanniella sp.]|uniref:hypothetical protein n=1 Tax=uncultured Friedmanniella sp. TaxID=335381 RepID=UPI0035CC9BE7
MAKVPRDERFGWFWRLRWTIEYGLMHVYGPAALDDARDPRVQMKRDHDRRKAAHQARQATAAAHR